MASPPSKTTAPRRNSSSLRSSTIGRGGAGNVGYTPTEIDPATLETPHLKSEIYTTGRGGTGNMARNTDAEEARRAQDVVAYVLPFPPFSLLLPLHETVVSLLYINPPNLIKDKY